MTESIIRSRTNPLVKRLRALKDRGAGGDLALLEGFTLVEEGARRRAPIRGGGGDARGRRDRARPRPGASAGEAARARPARGRFGPGLAVGGGDEPGARSRSRGGPLSRRTSIYAAPAARDRGGRAPEPGQRRRACCARPRPRARPAPTSRGAAPIRFSWKALRGAMGSAFRVPHVRGLAAAEVLERLRRARRDRPGRGRGQGRPLRLRRPATARWRLLLGQEAGGLDADLAAAGGRPHHDPDGGPRGEPQRRRGRRACCSSRPRGSVRPPAFREDWVRRAAGGSRPAAAG